MDISKTEALKHQSSDFVEEISKLRKKILKYRVKFKPGTAGVIFITFTNHHSSLAVDTVKSWLTYVHRYLIHEINATHKVARLQGLIGLTTIAKVFIVIIVHN